MKAHNKETQSTTTPEKALQFLKEGNYRFLNNLKDKSQSACSRSMKRATDNFRLPLF